MKPYSLSVLVKIAIMVFALCGILICIFAYPNYVTAATLTGEDQIPTPDESYIINAQIIFFRIVSIPCFILLALFWKLTGSIAQSTVFSYGTSKLFKACSLILLIDVTILITGNIVMSCLGWNIFPSIKAVLPAAGMIVTVALYLLSHLINEAARLKEEVSGTI